jgi:cytochrome c5
MRADTVRAGRVATTVAIAAALAALAGCRAAGAGGRIEPGPAQALQASAEAAEIAALPDAAGKTLVTERCLLCHSAGLITQQRKDPAAWGRTVTQMRTWGTPIQDADQAALVAYLTEHFGPGRVRTGK